MAGTNAVTVKKALMDLLRAAAGLVGVQVDYAWNGRAAAREYIYGGRVRAEQHHATLRGAGQRLPRDEALTVTVHIVVDQPGGDTVDTDTRAVALGAVIEDTLATNPTLGSVPGLLYGGIASAELDYLADDDSMSSLLSYEIAFRSRLT